MVRFCWMLAARIGAPMAVGVPLLKLLPAVHKVEKSDRRRWLALVATVVLAATLVW